MAVAHRRVSIANPARRKFSLKQIRAGFGGKRRQAAVKTKRSTHRARAQKRNTVHRRRTSPRAVRRNLGEQVLLTLGNPKRKPASGGKAMARHRTKTSTASVHHRRRSHRTNPRRQYTARRHNRVVRHHRRHNPMGGSWGAEITHALYIIAGAIGSKLGAQMVLGTSNTGFMGYGANLAAGGILAWAAKGIMKNTEAAKGIFAGSVVQVVLRLITDYTPFGQYASLQGVGDYMASNWVTPQRYVDGLHNAQIEIPDGWGPAPMVMASSGVNANAVAAGSDGMGAF
jgi:hypothetical protein